MKRILILSFLLGGCETATTTGNVPGAVLVVAAAAAGKSPGNFGDNGHMVQVSGAVSCGTEKFYNFTNTRVDLFDGEILILSMDVDEMGHFNRLYKSIPGPHSAQLVLKSNSRILDKTDFISNENKDRFNIDLKACGINK